MNEIKTPDLSGAEWLPCIGLQLTPHNLSVPDRLDIFGYTVILDQSAASRVEKAELCVHDVLMKKNCPNIIIFCPANLMQCWYLAMLQDIGTEFKYLNFDEREIPFFNKSLANMYIADSGQLHKSNECTTVRELRASGIVWDLMIIDLPFSIEGTETGTYITEIRNKTEKLAICAPAPSKYNEDCDNVSALAKHLLNKKEQAEAVERYPIDVSLLDFNPRHPVIKDDGPDKSEYRVTTLYYEIDESLTQQSKRIDDIQTGIPLYTYGGNIFEEYSLEERKTYLRGDYSGNDIDILCSVDKKLEVFLDAVKKAVSDGGTIIVYAICENTAEYLQKALNAVFHGKDAEVNIKVSDTSSIPEKQIRNDGANTRIVISNDEAGWSFNGITQVTHIFNYEYPDNPAVLQMRYMRRGRGAGRAPEFYIFIDNNYRFDGRVLRKSVLSSLHYAFHKRIPAKNILMFAEDIDRHITALLLDLKFIHQYTGEVGSSFETVTRFRTEYNIPDAAGITTAAKAHERTGRILKKLTDMLNITEFEKSSDERALYEAVVEKVSVMRSCYAYFDDGGRLRFLNKGSSALYEEYASSLGENRFIKGVRAAESGFNNFSDSDVPCLREATGLLSDTMKMSVLFSLRKFCSDKSFAKLMLLYNRGMM